MRVLILAAFSLFLAGTAGATPAPPAQSAAEHLHALIAHAWQQEMKNHPVEASLDGYHRYDDRWADPSLQQQRRETREMKENLAALEKIDVNELSPTDQLNYRLFEYQIKDAIAATGYADDDQGLITQLWGPQLMAGMVKQLRFATLADYQNWIKRLQSLGSHMDAFTARLEQAVDHGITQPRVVMERVPDEIAANIVKNPAQSPFYAPFKQMPSTISAAEQEKLRAEAKAAITNIVNPAYAKFLAFFKNDYLPHARTAVGVSALPGGKAYYAYLVRHYTTTDMTPEQVHALGLKLVAQIQSQMQALFKQIGFKGSYRDFLNHLRTDPKFYYKNPQQLLEAYRAAAKRVDPNLVKIAGTWLLPRVPYGVRPIPTALAPNTYPAYSVPPAGDGSVAGYVGVNLYKPQSRPKYAIQVLMCHEGRPGHQLQIPVADELHNLPPFRRFAYYNAYGEGWALYAETLCDQPLGLYDDPYSKFGYLNYQMWRAVRLVVDTDIHYYGWSREKAVKYMQDNTALADQNIATEVDRYIVWPGQALSYMIGERTILSLRAEAQQKLGDKYTLQDFDDVVLGQGSLPMAVLKDVVKRWIAHTLAGKPADQLPYASSPRSLGSAMNDPPVSPVSPDSAAGAQSGAPAASAARPMTFPIAHATLVNPTTLQVYYVAGAPTCTGELGKVDLNESSSTVTVTLHRVWPPGSEQPHLCPHYRMFRWTDVKLAAPLDNRKLVDGTTGKAVPPTP